MSTVPLGLEDKEAVAVETEFGVPADELVQGRLHGVDVVVLARHGRKHVFNPTDVPYRANIRALQKIGVTHVLAATACGSLKEELPPGHLVVLDSFIDRTTKRVQTFHDQSSPSPPFGSVCHIPIADAFDGKLRAAAVAAAKRLKLDVASEGTMVTIEGPRFSSRAESGVFRSWGASVINMTTVPEVVLAAEAGLLYASVAMVTDYDVWRSSEESVDVAKVK